MLVLLAAVATGAWAQEQSETIVTTDNIVEGTHFTIDNHGNNADEDGMDADGGITVTSKNGETITKVVISCTYNPGSVNDGNTTVSSGTKEITNGGLTITVTGVNASTFTFTCSVNSPQFGQFVVYYTEATVAVTGVTLAPTSATLTLGETETVTLIPTVLPDDATDKSVAWSSSNEAVATVSNDGVVTAVAAGTATITVTTTDGAKTATCAVTVAAPAASTYTVTLKEGTEDATSWTIAPAEATTTGVAAGTTVTATYSGTKMVKSVKAVKKAAASIPLDNTTTAWTAGTYAVPAGGLTYSAAITVSGDVTLVLTDGETLTLNKGISLAEGATLTVEGNGTMNINGTDGNTSSTVGGNHGTLILTSGTLTATGGNGGNIGMSTDDSHGGNGGDAINGSVIVSGGTLTAWGGNGGSVDYMCYNCSGGNGGKAISGTLTINGGSTSVNDGSNGSIGSQCDYCTAGTGGKAVAGTVTDNR